MWWNVSNLEFPGPVREEKETNGETISSATSKKNRFLPSGLRMKNIIISDKCDWIYTSFQVKQRFNA